MKRWSKIIQPNKLTIIGGEPLIHPRIYDILKHARKCFPKSRIEIATNGLLLSKKPKLKETIEKIGNASINLSLHNSNQDIKDKIYQLVNRYILDKKWKKTSDYSWKKSTVRLEITPETEIWQEYRKVINEKLKPYNDKDPKASYAACGVNIFPIVYKGRIYKCPPISMLRTHLEKYRKLDDPDWEPYLKYKGISYNDSADTINKFMKNIYKPHHICGMCPANPDYFDQKEALIKHSIKKI
jgi:MoaA/NifB/PqqE/SkfB family radical SAM enzyme